MQFHVLIFTLSLREIAQQEILQKCIYRDSKEMICYLKGNVVEPVYAKMHTRWYLFGSECVWEGKTMLLCVSAQVQSAVLFNWNGQDGQRAASAAH